MVTECPENKFRCPKGGPDGKPLCINRSQLCDEKQDCEDGADEEAACCKCARIFCDQFKPEASTCECTLEVHAIIGTLSKRRNLFVP